MPPAKTTLSNATLSAVRTSLRRANQRFAKRFPGERSDRQPVHTVYGGAQLFKPDTAQKLGQVAIKALEEYAPDAQTLAQAVGMGGDSGLHERVYARVVEKLKREAVEDQRIDFEDGYGNRPDVEEDGHAVSAAEAVAQGMRGQSLPPFIGIRIKPFNDELFARSARTLDLFLSTLAKATRGKLPGNFVVTLPKVTVPEQVVALGKVLTALEKAHRLPRIPVELMVETPQAIIAEDGSHPLPRLVAAGDGRVIAAHFGTYDYTAGVNVTAAYQRIDHPACDFAKHVMQVSLAGTGVWLSDGANNVMPVGKHRPASGQSLSPEQREENRRVVHAAWKLSYGQIRHALVQGFYQGWDLHPAQLPVRYAAVYAFFLEGLVPASNRLRSFVDKAAQATLLGDVFDDAATGQGLLNFFLRGIACGAISEEEARATGLALDEIRTRSFLRILEGRKVRAA